MYTIPSLLCTVLLLAIGSIQGAEPATPRTSSAETKVKDVSPEEAEKLLKEKKDVVVLDVRTAEEFKEGHIAGAKNFDFMEDDFEKQVSKLDPSKSYLLHCASGARSTRALEKIEGKVPSVYHLKGGFKAWEKAGKPVAK